MKRNVQGYCNHIHKNRQVNYLLHILFLSEEKDKILLKLQIYLSYVDTDDGYYNLQKQHSNSNNSASSRYTFLYSFLIIEIFLLFLNSNEKVNNLLNRYYKH